MSVSVIIPAFNEEDRLARTLESVQLQTVQPKQIIVVDDGSTDRTGKIAEQMGVDIVRPEKRCGSKASAQNCALPFVTAKYVIAIDADTVLGINSVEKLLEAMEGDRKAVGACSWVATLKQNTFWQKGRSVEYFFAFFWFKRVQNFYHRPLICSGAFNIFRTSTLRWLGGYPDDTLAEDMNLTWEIYARQIGRILFVPSSIAYTDDPENFTQMKAQLNRWSSAYFQNVRKHFWRLWRKDKKAFGFMFLGLIDAAAGMFFYPLIVAIAVLSNWVWVLSLLIWDAALVTGVAMCGAHRLRMTRKILSFMPGFWVLRTISTLYFLKWLILTGVLGRSISSYEKGH